MLTKNQYILCLFLFAAVGMVLGAGVGLCFPDCGLHDQYAITEVGLYFSPDFTARPLAVLFEGCVPHVKWMLFLLFCGFCAFAAPMTVLCGSVSAFFLGHACALWNQGALSLMGPVLLVLGCAATLWLAYLSFSFWEVLRDGHICRLYPIENAVFYRLIFRYFKIGSCVLLARIALICLFRFLPFS